MSAKLTQTQSRTRPVATTIDGQYFPSAVPNGLGDWGQNSSVTVIQHCEKPCESMEMQQMKNATKLQIASKGNEGNKVNILSHRTLK